MKLGLSLVVWVFIEVSSLFFFTDHSFASDIFVDNFSSLDSNIWNYYENNGSILIDDNALLLSAPMNNKFPYVALVEDLHIDHDYQISVRFKFSGNLQYGNGIVFSNKKIENGSAIAGPSDFIFQIWPKNSINFGIFTSTCSPMFPTCQENTITNEVITDPTMTLSGSWHVLEIKYTQGVYTLSLDGHEIFSSSISSQKITTLWFGNFELLKSTPIWADLFIDYIHVSSGSDTVPVVVIPGLGASWDLDAILNGTNGNNWQIPKFVNVYDGLINSLKNVGYSDSVNPNLFVFAYDWRRSLDTLADKLNEYIDGLPLDPDEKVDLIGHSMGGLVARAYAQKYGIAKINKILMIGSPNMGTVKAYPVWEGAQVWDDVWWAKVVLEMTTHFGSEGNATKVGTLQSMVPSIKDLLPTYDFLIQNGTVIPWQSLKNKNLYLDELNHDYLQINGLTSVIFSNDVQTDSQIKVISPTNKEISANLWIDGKPMGKNPFVSANGDGTVTETSTKGSFGNILEGNNGHGELITEQENIKHIFSILGLDQTKVVAGVVNQEKQVFIAALRSPGKLEICNQEATKCNSQLGIYLADQKLFFMPGYNNENLIVRILEDGELGRYNLHLGQIDNTANWVVTRGDLSKDGEIDVYRIKSNGQQIAVQASPADFEHCKKDGWRRFDFFHFRNQGECVSFVEKNTHLRNRFFWWR